MIQKAFPSGEFVEVHQGTDRPVLSVLMPIYKQFPLVKQAVQSVLAQQEVPVEIIISDDASGDDTFAEAQRAVETWVEKRKLIHRVVMRKGAKRLIRDHLALLVDHATCDIVTQAHGDDLSHPQRASVLSRAFAALPTASLLTSKCKSIQLNEPHPGAWPHLQEQLSVDRYDIDPILNARDSFLIGAMEAWRKSAFTGFDRLDMDFAACSHDRILPFRAFLAGEVGLIDAELIIRRVHRAAWTSQMFIEPQIKPMFGWSLTKATCHQAMLKDLARAKELGLVDNSKFEDLSQRLNNLLAADMENALTAFRLHTRAGRRIAWRDDG